MASANHNKQKVLVKSRPGTPKRVSFAEEPMPRFSHKKRYSSNIVEQDDHVPLALLAYKKGYLHHSSPTIMTTSSSISVDSYRPSVGRNLSSTAIARDSTKRNSLPPMPHPMSIELRPEYHHNDHYDHHKYRKQRPHRYSLHAPEDQKPKRKQRPKSLPPQYTALDSKREKASANETKQAPTASSPPETLRGYFVSLKHRLRRSFHLF